MTMRTAATEDAYRDYRDKHTLPSLHDEVALREWEYWRLLNNRFPYTKIASTHAMVVLKRDCDIFDIKPKELFELWYEILPWADKIYDTSTINMASLRSIKGTPHLHLIVYLPEYK